MYRGPELSCRAVMQPEELDKSLELDMVLTVSLS